MFLSNNTITFAGKKSNINTTKINEEASSEN